MKFHCYFTQIIWGLLGYYLINYRTVHGFHRNLIAHTRFTHTNNDLRHVNSEISIISELESNYTLCEYLSTQLVDNSKTSIRKMIRRGLIRINGLKYDITIISKLYLTFIKSTSILNIILSIFLKGK